MTSSPEASQAPDTARALAEAQAACVDTAERLAAAGIEPEALAEWVDERRVLLVRRKARMLPIGRVWRLPPLLLGEDGSLYRVGRATRAAERGRPGYQSVSREERREIAAAALRGGFTEGQPVNFDAESIDLSALANAPAAADASSPVGFAGGAIRVRWSPAAPIANGPTLADFLADRAGLLITPPL